MFKKITYATLVFFIFSFTLITYCFALSPSSDTIYEGIDVSNWQGYIDYNEVKNAGIQIVYIKASQGSNITDPYFRTNYDNAKANGLSIGLYHFLTARNTRDALDEAEYFASVISGTSPDCRLAMDFENFDNLSREDIDEISRTFLERVKELTGKDLIIYSDAFNARNTFSLELANTYPLWIAEYGVETPSSDVNWSSWTGFQFTDMGIIRGIRGLVDRDRFASGIFLSENEAINTSPNVANKIETYTVQRGNTLSGIALRFGTTVAEIAGLNGIRNPNLIFTGEVLKIDTTRALLQITNDSYDTNHIIYTIKGGNTLTQIARMFDVTINSIVRLNGIRNPNLIFAGERLRINN